jgi:hypothetical protein
MELVGVDVKDAAAAGSWSLPTLARLFQDRQLWRIVFQGIPYIYVALGERD